MKIEYVVVDTLPKNCNECDLCRETKYLIDECMVIDNESLPFDKDFRFFDTKKGRHENCPLRMKGDEMSDIETKEIKNNSEQLKHDILDFIARKRDKLDKSMIHILEKLADDGHLTFAEMIYLILNTFIDGKEFDELKTLITNRNMNVKNER